MGGGLGLDFEGDWDSERLKAFILVGRNVFSQYFVVGVYYVLGVVQVVFVGSFQGSGGGYGYRGGGWFLEGFSGVWKKCLEFCVGFQKFCWFILVLVFFQRRVVSLLYGGFLSVGFFDFLDGFYFQIRFLSLDEECVGVYVYCSFRDSIGKGFVSGNEGFQGRKVLCWEVGGQLVCVVV